MQTPIHSSRINFGPMVMNFCYRAAAFLAVILLALPGFPSAVPAEELKVTVLHTTDLHATLLHLLGFDHERLTFRLQGRDYRLTDVHGKLVRGLLA